MYWCGPFSMRDEGIAVWVRGGVSSATRRTRACFFVVLMYELESIL